MYSSKNYEKLWRKYQTEGIAHNMTLQMFCSMNNVAYNSYEDGDHIYYDRSLIEKKLFRRMFPDITNLRSLKQFFK